MSTAPSTFTTHDPATGAVIAEHTESSPADIADAVAAAAAVAPELAAATPERRAVLLEAIADAIEDLGDGLIGLAARESGLDVARLTGERARTTNQLRLFARVVRDGEHLGVVIDHPDSSTVPPTPDLRRTVVPVGPVAVFGASNFPLAFGVAGGDTASALAAGCPVVAKAHPSNAGTSALVAEAIATAIARAGAPAATFALVQGASHEVGRALVTAEAIAAVGFTGSLAGGRALLDLASARERPIPVHAEMGSHNPVFVLPGALAARAEAIAAGLATAVTLGVGQFCTNPGVVFVPEGPAADAFVAALAAAVDATEVGPMLDARIAANYAERSAGLAALGGVTVATARRAPSDAASGAGWRATPAVLATDLATWEHEGALREECFGPVTVVVRTPTAGLARAATTVPSGLAAALHVDADGTDDALAAELLPLLAARFGRILFDGFPTGVAVSWAQQHGGPYPATTSPLTTSVGARAIDRFLRPVAYQDVPERLLPEWLRDANPWRLPRRVDGVLELPDA